ncbi:MAG: bifunctional precorrin-2 dehydrogenase/sirohydrochlorin ferrochelatase [Desulfobacterales bacterium]
MPMRYYPINLDVQNRPCLVVGGGAVGHRKVSGLLKCGARVTVVSPAAHPALSEMASEGVIDWHQRPYRPEDLDGKLLVIGATDDEVLNQRISRDAAERQLLCNIADRPAVCNFILPAVIERGDLIITVSTSGRSPAFAKKLRQDLEAAFGEPYADFLALMGAIRAKLLAEAHAPEAHKPLFEKLIAADLLALVRRRDLCAIDALLEEVLGEGFSAQSLIQFSPDNERQS